MTIEKTIFGPTGEEATMFFKVPDIEGEDISHTAHCRPFTLKVPPQPSSADGISDSTPSLTRVNIDSGDVSSRLHISQAIAVVPAISPAINFAGFLYGYASDSSGGGRGPYPVIDIRSSPRVLPGHIRKARRVTAIVSVPAPTNTRMSPVFTLQRYRASPPFSLFTFIPERSRLS